MAAVYGGRDIKPSRKLSGNIHQEINVFPDKYYPGVLGTGWELSTYLFK
jgi:hypothetical protein